MRERITPTRTPTLSDKIGRWVDRALFVFAPALATARLKARRRHERVERVQMRLEGAETNQTRGKSWIGSKLSPDSELEEDQETLRDRSRELHKTDPIGGCVDTRVNLVVSSGFTPQAMIKERAGVISPADALRWNQEIEDVYTQWSPRCGLSGRESLWQLCRLAERLIAVDGECLTILSDVRSPDKPIPLTVEVIDAARLETPPEHFGNPNVRLGIEYDANKQIVAYHIRNSNPHDTRDIDLTYTRYEAHRVLHVFEKWAAGQSRGLPWLTRTLNRIKDIHDYDEALLIAAQVQACFAAFVTKEINPLDAAAGDSDDEKNGQLYRDITPGSFHYMAKGEDVKFPNQSNAGSAAAPFYEMQYRRMAGAMNFPYEMLAKNWGGLSFAAGRLSLADARLFVRSEQKLVTEQWLMPIWALMIEESIITGQVSIPAGLYARHTWLFHMHAWGAPAWPYALTPGEEIDAWVTAIDENMATKAEACAEFGRNFEDVFAQRKRERELEREFKIEPTKGKPAVDPVVAAKKAQAPQVLERMAA